jgi:hypothetical protein
MQVFVRQNAESPGRLKLGLDLLDISRRSPRRWDGFCQYRTCTRAHRPNYGICIPRRDGGPELCEQLKKNSKRTKTNREVLFRREMNSQPYLIGSVSFGPAGHMISLRIKTISVWNLCRRLEGRDAKGQTNLTALNRPSATQGTLLNRPFSLQRTFNSHPTIEKSHWER